MSSGKLVWTYMISLTVFFGIMKYFGVIDWELIWIFSPFWFTVLFGIVAIFLSSILTYVYESMDDMDKNDKIN